MEFRNQHLHSGFATLWSEDKSKSMRVFYVLRSSEISIGKVAWMPQLDVQEIDYRGHDEPEWIWKPSILATDTGKRYNIQRNVGFWTIAEIQTATVEKGNTDGA
jgi:hypothetical protein